MSRNRCFIFRFILPPYTPDFRRLFSCYILSTTIKITIILGGMVIRIFFFEPINDIIIIVINDTY